MVFLFRIYTYTQAQSYTNQYNINSHHKIIHARRSCTIGQKKGHLYSLHYLLFMLDMYVLLHIFIVFDTF